MFIQFFIRVAAIFCMIGFGILAKKLQLIDRSATAQLSRLVTWFFYPALIFSSLVENFTLQTLLSNAALPAGALIIMTIGYITGFFVTRLIKFQNHRQKCQFLFQSTINNYSFLPLPIVLMLWGNEGVARLIFSTFGSEVALWTIGILALTGNRLRLDSVKRLFSVPMLAILAAIAVIALRSYLPNPPSPAASGHFTGALTDSILEMLDIFGRATIPLAMFLAGSRVADLKADHFLTFKQLTLVTLRLAVIPAAAVIVLFTLPFPGEIRETLLVVAVMPSAIMSVVLSEVYDSDTDFAASAVLTTQLCSIFTIPIWLTLFFG